MTGRNAIKFFYQKDSSSYEPFPLQEIYRLFIAAVFYKKTGYKAFMKFENREPGCLEAFMRTFCYIQYLAIKNTDIENLFEKEFLLDLCQRLEPMECRQKPASQRTAKWGGEKYYIHYNDYYGIYDSDELEKLQLNEIYGELLNLFGEEKNLIVNQKGELFHLFGIKDLEIEFTRGENYFVEFDSLLTGLKKHLDLFEKKDADFIAKSKAYLKKFCAIPEPTDNDVLINTIVAYSRFIQLKHGMEDYNNRTVICAYMQLLFIKYGLPVTTMYSYDIFDIKSQAYVLQEVIRGMEHTKEIYKNYSKGNEDFTLTETSTTLITPISFFYLMLRYISLYVNNIY